MKQSKYSEAQIMGILNQAESGVPVADLCREYGMSTASWLCCTNRPEVELPLIPQTDSCYGHGTGYAKSCEAV